MRRTAGGDDGLLVLAHVRIPGLSGQRFR